MSSTGKMLNKINDSPSQKGCETEHTDDDHTPEQALMNSVLVPGCDAKSLEEILRQAFGYEKKSTPENK